MATMIPTEPYEYTRESHEGDIFRYFEKNLPKEYYVFHSVILDSFDEESNKFDMHEMDFLVFHPALGLLCIECKGGTTGKVYLSGRKFGYLIELEPGTGKYQKGKPYREGPFRQSKERMHDLIKYIKKQSIVLSKAPEKKLIDHCKVAFAVCFPGITSSEEIITICENNDEKSLKFIDMLNSCETPEQKVIYGNDLKSADLLKAKVDKILSYDSGRGIKTGYETGQETRDPLTEEDVQNLFNLVLCPNYDIAETLDFNTGEKKYVQLNQEQRTVLKMMDYQQNMAVFGFAGTGKTVIALQKARLEAMKGNAVLYLCSTPLMEDTLRKMEGCNDSRNGVKNKIKIINIDRLKEEWEVGENDWGAKIEKGMERLIEDINSKKNDKRRNKDINNKKDDKKKRNICVIVDEGQDYGTKERERLLTGIFNFVTKGTAVVPAEVRSIFQTNRRGSFYIFYDQYQLFKRKNLPGIINEINCRVPLLRNCRNTESIAITAFSTIWGEDDSVLFAPCTETGEKVKVIFCESDKDMLLRLDELLKPSNENNRGEGETVILTARDRISESVLVTEKGEEHFVRNGSIWYYKPFQETEKTFMFTTVSDYKGLECDHVILIDFAPNELVFEDSDIYRCLFYTAVTRAIKKAEIIVKNSACGKLTINYIENSKLPNKFLVRAKKNFEQRDEQYEPPRTNFVNALAAEAVWDK